MTELRQLFADHYWDTFQQNRDLIMQHVDAVLAMHGEPQTPSSDDIKNAVRDGFGKMGLSARWEVLEAITDAVCALSRPMTEWQIVYDEVNDEMFAPADAELLLGWWETWPELRWRQEVGEYRNTRGHWCHGHATHFQPLPSPPPVSPAVPQGKQS